MNERPTEWKTIKLGFLGEFFKGSGITKNDLIQGGLPCVRYAELYTKFDFIIPFCISFISEDTAKTARPIQKGDILFAGSGETKEEIGKCAVYMNDLNAYAGGDNIIFRTTQAEPLYLSFYLNTLGRKQLNKLGQGDSIVHIRSNDLKNIIIPFPPLPEQEKIAEILGTWDTAIEKLSSLIEQKKLMKKGLMQRLLSGKQRLPGFSEPWKKVKLKNVCNVSKGSQLGKLEMLDNGTFPVMNGGTTPSGLTDSFNQPENTITISEGGNSCGFISLIKEKFWCGGHCYALENLKMNLLLLFQILKGNENSIMKLRVGSGLPNIQKSNIENFSFYMPETTEEQKAIADILSKADEEIDLLTVKLSALKEQKKGLMQKLLTGQIRVKVA